jgi:hypothetical protein
LSGTRNAADITANFRVSLHGAISFKVAGFMLAE